MTSEGCRQQVRASVEEGGRRGKEKRGLVSGSARCARRGDHVQPSTSGWDAVQARSRERAKRRDERRDDPCSCLGSCCVLWLAQK
jgi:hypothetical protein